MTFVAFSAVVLVVAVRAEVALLSKPEAVASAPAAEEAAPEMMSRVALTAEASCRARM